MNHLRRELAPLTGEAWSQIEEEAERVLRVHLAARKVVDFEGPHGWTHSADALGQAERLDEAPVKGVSVRLRDVLPLVEVRVTFDLSLMELEDAARGREDPEMGPLVEAAKLLAHAEDRAVFHGFERAGVVGICEGSEHHPVSLSGHYDHYPQAFTEAAEQLRQAGVDGPYALVLGPDSYAGLATTRGEGGYPILQHVRRLVDGPVVWAPSVDTAAVVSLRGGDFRLIVGQDATIGYLDHDAERVRLYLEESFTFRLLGPEAAVPLVLEG